MNISVNSTLYFKSKHLHLINHKKCVLPFSVQCIALDFKLSNVYLLLQNFVMFISLDKVKSCLRPFTKIKYALCFSSYTKLSHVYLPLQNQSYLSSFAKFSSVYLPLQNYVMFILKFK